MRKEDGGRRIHFVRKLCSGEEEEEEEEAVEV